MKKPKVISAAQAVDMIQDGSTLCTIGMTLISASETILKEIERRFLEECDSFADGKKSAHEQRFSVVRRTGSLIGGMTG